MKCGEYQVAGQRGLERNLGGVLVADLADRDHLGVLTQQRFQARFERQAGGRVDLRLRDARHDRLDRDLRASPGCARRVTGPPARAGRHKSWSSCRSRRAREDDRARRLAQQVLELIADLPGKPRSSSRRNRPGAANIRTTAFSPNKVGKVLTRISTSPGSPSIRPSWGTSVR